MFIAICLLLEIAISFTLAHYFVLTHAAKPRRLAIPNVSEILTGIVSYRLLDIMQTAININVFDNIRKARSQHLIASASRSVVLSMINYIELIICFAIIYALMPESNIPGVKSYFDCVYFSVVTQLTVGYGDIVPVNGAKYIVTIQSMCGFILAVLVIARYISSLPKLYTVLGGDAVSSGNERRSPTRRGVGRY